MDKSNFDWATQICLGFSDDVGDRKLTGKMRNVEYKMITGMSSLKNKLMFNAFSTNIDQLAEKVYFDVNNVDPKYVEKSQLNVDWSADKDEGIIFNNGWLAYTSEKLRSNDSSKDEGLPHQNFKFEFSFKTNQAKAGLFCLDSPGKGGHDRHVMIQDKKLNVRVWPNLVFTVCDDNVADGKWHHFKIVCQKQNPIKIYLDGDFR